MSTKREEAIALLEYMVKHNRHHAEELAAIVGQLEEALELAKENDKGGAR